MAEHNFEVRWYQDDFYDAFLYSDLKRFIEIAHRRWGKDEIILQGTRDCMFNPQVPKYRVGNYWHCLPEYSQGRKALWDSVNAHTGKKRIDEAFPPEIRKRTDNGAMLIELLNGSTWQIVGSDSYDNLVGAGVVGITFSEWALANPSAWGYIRPMLEENGGWAAFITTPRGRNHAKAMYEMAVQSPNWFAEISDVYHTGALTDDQLAESLLEYQTIYGEDVGRAQFEQEYLCSFNASILGAYYAKEMALIRKEKRVRPVIPVPGQPVHTAWDIGVRDDTSIWWFQVLGDRPYILDCHTEAGGNVEHFAELVHSKPYKPGIDFVPHDAKNREWGSGRTRMESMIKYGLNPRLVPNVSKLDGIQAVRETLKKAIFDPRTEEEGLSALEQFRRKWDDERKMFEANEHKDWSVHLADAFRYLSLAWKEAPKVVPKEKKIQQTGQVILPGPPEESNRVRIKV